MLTNKFFFFKEKQIKLPRYVRAYFRLALPVVEVAAAAGMAVEAAVTAMDNERRKDEFPEMSNGGIQFPITGLPFTL